MERLRSFGASGLLESAYTVFMAEDVQMGLEMHLAQAPDILMLDIELPDFSGHELAATLRRFDPDLFIIMVTANKNMDDLKRARDNGAKAFIVKPYSKQKILDAVGQFVPKKIR
jgi:DNA-binding response OmpR family regulator